MAVFGRPSVIPRDVIARATLTRGEKLLASAQLTDGSWLLATAHALYRLPGAPGDAAERQAGTTQAAEAPADGLAGEEAGGRWRRAWTDVDIARFNGESRELAIRWATGQGEEVYPLSEDATRHFTRTINERVTASVVASREISVPGGKARIAVRKAPNGTLFSQVITLGPVDAADPATARAIDEVESVLREAAGMR